MENRSTLLIVDDLEINRAILGNIFKKKYEIVEATNGIEALEYIRKNPDKIVSILLDLIMPEMNGIEVLRTMKLEGLAEGIPVFIITADNSDEAMYEAYELGVKDIIEKPFVPYFLKKRIENVIELYEIKEQQADLILEKVTNIEELERNIDELLRLVNESQDNTLKSEVKSLQGKVIKLLRSLK